ncbi:hypothetical protein LCR01_09780 [Companilactobacillus crustorum]|uniref:Uncharacterized protein n=1 Tax=Companilactobacillus crustorum TaxID=392416 RepID=A0AB34AAQ0_9LACO|nr:hypothetical protein LCR01_09780 [Companilactobacillus crustorum]
MVHEFFSEVGYWLVFLLSRMFLLGMLGLFIMLVFVYPYRIAIILGIIGVQL